MTGATIAVFVAAVALGRVKENSSLSALKKPADPRYRGDETATGGRMRLMLFT